MQPIKITLILIEIFKKNVTTAYVQTKLFLEIKDKCNPINMHYLKPQHIFPYPSFYNAVSSLIKLFRNSWYKTLFAIPKQSLRTVR